MKTEEKYTNQSVNQEIAKSEKIIVNANEHLKLKDKY